MQNCQPVLAFDSLAETDEFSLCHSCKRITPRQNRGARLPSSDEEGKSRAAAWGGIDDWNKAFSLEAGHAADLHSSRIVGTRSTCSTRASPVFTWPIPAQLHKNHCGWRGGLFFERVSLTVARALLNGEVDAGRP